MSVLTNHTDARSGFSPAVGEKLSAFWAGLRSGFMTFDEGNRRIAEVRRLQAMSDAELAERGIARDRVVHFVFRDMFGSRAGAPPPKPIPRHGSGLEAGAESPACGRREDVDRQRR